MSKNEGIAARFVSSRHLSHACFLQQFDLNFLRLTTA
jgi:hypothetical protein